MSTYYDVMLYTINSTMERGIHAVGGVVSSSQNHPTSV